MHTHDFCSVLLCTQDQQHNKTLKDGEPMVRVEVDLADIDSYRMSTFLLAPGAEGQPILKEILDAYAGHMRVMHPHVAEKVRDPCLWLFGPL